ncbi:adenylate isopentenyltransferase-like [Zingiber officinale]|uniref:adenylate isopentenyltransferase-like n=1 Tax=Zingiber officinale TaxID=94328 RepID=UPI001C4C0BD2|nr:adenylate isopentenyltransferase-like [Zingiber officinale]
MEGATLCMSKSDEVFVSGDFSCSTEKCNCHHGSHAAINGVVVDMPRTPVSKERLVVVMGATGTGKTKLAIELSLRFLGEVINSDKIQVYPGLDIASNKIAPAKQRGVPHHLLDFYDSASGELPAAEYRAVADYKIQEVSARGRVPFLTGGSNSFVYALLADQFDPNYDPFVSEEMREERAPQYDCLFIWVHVDAKVLAEHLARRVDEMVQEGLMDELADFFMKEGAKEKSVGIGKTIGVSEFRAYFTEKGMRTRPVYEAALAAMKENTRLLSEIQIQKIKRLQSMGWPLLRVDATAAVTAYLSGEDGAMVVPWQRDVIEPSTTAVAQFLEKRSN